MTYVGGSIPPPPLEECGMGGTRMTMCEDPACYRERPHCVREWGCRWSRVATIDKDGQTRTVDKEMFELRDELKDRLS